ncbi:hypothetical protein ABTX35_38815, partial [Streptomyces sp. NPDC096080]|uniref:hypothetical protein n=1 Tax=Streptomyces sp. NPDC096080 TaxID=3156693 RepID=UPI003325527B
MGEAQHSTIVGDTGISVPDVRVRGKRDQKGAYGAGCPVSYALPAVRRGRSAAVGRRAALAGA